MRKFLSYVAVLSLFSLMALPALAVGKPNTKVNVCHLEGKNSGRYHLINVSEKALKAHLDHGDMIEGTQVVNSEEVTVDVTYFGHWYYTANFVQNGTELTGTLTDPYVPDYTQPIINGTINGDHVEFSFDYGPGSVQGVRTYVGDIQPSGDLVGTWTQTGPQGGGDVFTIPNFAIVISCQ